MSQLVPKKKNVLKEILARPNLPSLIQSLPASTILKIVEKIGLEDAGEIVGLVTTEQLEEIFDEDLWHSFASSKVDEFDPERFGLWLEILAEADSAKAAEKIVELDEEILILGLSGNILVLNFERLNEEMQTYGERRADLVEKAMDSTLMQQFDESLIFSLNADSWDAILNIFLELDSKSHSFLSHILDRLCAISEDNVEDNGGLYQVLTGENLIQEDALASRDERRTEKGFVSSSSAAGFLKLIEIESMETILNASEPDPYTKEYFRSFKPQPAILTGSPFYQVSPKEAEEFSNLLIEAGVLDGQENVLKIGAALEPDAVKFGKALDELRETSPEIYSLRLAETSYLANILIASRKSGKKKDRPTDAASETMQFIVEGAKHLNRDFSELILKHSFVHLFKIGFKLKNRSS